MVGKLPTYVREPAHRLAYRITMNSFDKFILEFLFGDCKFYPTTLEISPMIHYIMLYHLFRIPYNPI